MICAVDREAAIAMKARLRCGWQPVAQALGVSVTDLRRVCDPAFAFALAVPARPVTVPAKAAEAPKPAVYRHRVARDEAPSLAGLIGAVEALRALAAAGAEPAGRFVMSAAAAQASPGGQWVGLGRLLGRLETCEPPLVERQRRGGNIAVWRLTEAGMAALRVAV